MGALLVPQSAVASWTGTDRSDETHAVGSCTVQYGWRVADEVAYISFLLGDGRWFNVSFASWDDGQITAGRGDFSETYITNNCGLNVDAGSMTIREADAPSFAEEDEISVSWTVDGGVRKYEYKLGSVPLIGAVVPAGTSAPTTSTATVSSDGLTVTLGMDEALGASAPVGGAFAVTVNGAVVVPTAVSINGSSVELTMPATVEAGSAVSIAYTKPDTGSVLEDVTGNEVASFDTAGSITTTNNSTADSAAPTVLITGPTGVVTNDFTVSFAFSESVTGFAAEDITVVNGTKGSFAGTRDSYTLVITPKNGTFVSVSVAADKAEDAAGNGNVASDAFKVQAGSVVSAFDAREDDIRQVITQDATRSLQSTLNANRRMTSDARERFVASQQVSEDNVSRNSLPFDVDGTFTLSETRLSTQGTFFEQRSNVDDTARRLFFGDFDLQHDGDSGSTTATITARMAWEQMYGDKTMLGYFVGGELAHSNIKGSFEGEQDRLGLSFGGYAVHQLDERVFLDGFITLGAGRNNLVIADDVLALTSDYTTRTATVGAALSGAYDFGKYEFHPELAFSYGKTWIGDVGFTGRAYGLVDETLSLDAGNVSLANLTLRPELIWALDADTVAESNSQLSFAPRLICERVQSTTTTQNCGAGGEIGLASTSRDGRSNAAFRVIVDKVGGSTRSSLVLNFERKF